MSGTVCVMTSTQFDPTHLAQARVAFKDGNSWVVVGATWRQSGLSSWSPMPAVTCPIVDLSPVEDDKALQQVMSAHVGGHDISGLLRDLVELGAVVVS